MVIAIAAVAVAVAAVAVVASLAFSKLAAIRRAQEVLLGGDGKARRGRVRGLAAGPRSTTCTAPSTRSPRRSPASTGASTGRSRASALIRYDAYEDTGGHQSASMAMLDSARSGIVLTAIQGRDYARVYVKQLDRGRTPIALSPEEQQAVERAMVRSAEIEAPRYP